MEKNIDFNDYLFNDDSDKPINNLSRKIKRNSTKSKEKEKETTSELNREKSKCNLVLKDPLDIKKEKLESLRLPREFYQSDALTLSKNLIGKVIIKKNKKETLKFVIVETEAYIGPLDKEAHSYKNKKTEKTKYFWQEAGKLYIYSIYGLNYCINISSKNEKSPEAILIRAVQPLGNLNRVKEIRKFGEKKMKIFDLSNGPGKVGACLEVDKSYNGFDLCKEDEIFIIENKEEEFRNFEVERSVRINIDYAEEYRFKPWRFFMKGNEYVSKVKIPYDYIEN